MGILLVLGNPSCLLSGRKIRDSEEEKILIGKLKVDFGWGGKDYFIWNKILFLNSQPTKISISILLILPLVTF